MILLRSDRDHSDVTAGLAAAMPGHSVEVNPFALRDHPLPLSLEEHSRRLD